MKALTIMQPYPELILRGLKPIENRTWPTFYRGELLIHAGMSKDWMDGFDLDEFPDMKFGYVVGVATLVTCLEKKSNTPIGQQLEQWGRHA